METTHDNSLNESVSGSKLIHRGHIVFAITLCLMSYLWLVLFPQWSQDPAVQATLERREEAGIDAAAMFYTDIPAAEEVISKLETLQREHPELLQHP